jgi:hypothetical protein
MTMQQTSASEAVHNTTHGNPLGTAFATALGHKDFDAVKDLLDQQVDFRALTPRRSWEATDPDAVVNDILRQWFDDSDELDEIVSIDSDSVADRERVSYRFHGHNADGPFVIEQQAYFTERDGRIDYMRVLCSGFRPR